MGDLKLCLFILLSTSALTYSQEEDTSCLLNQRYRPYHKYEYQYEAESLNGISGSSDLKNGPKGACKVEIEVPQSCSYIVRTTGCSLSEVAGMDADGNTVFRPAPSSDNFAAEMEKYPLKVVVEGVYDVKLYPHEAETGTILNIKRGIISALAVPLLEEEMNKLMPTIHGKCKTTYSVNAREDIATDISLSRDLSGCDKFNPIRDHTSPLALVSKLEYLAAQFVRSSQTCNYKFDNEQKHLTYGSCTENHILVPFSHKGQYGVTNVGKQELTLLSVSPHNDRVFELSEIVKGLNMEAVEDRTVMQDKEPALNVLRELASLPETQGERRANLFHKLVIMVRGMRTETLISGIPEALEVSRALTFQVLAQCGTPECSSGIMSILRTFEQPSLETDAAVFALGLVSNPSPLLINDMLQMAKYKPSKAIFYALSNAVRRYYKAEGKLIPEIYAVAEFMDAQLGDCSGDDDQTFMTLRVVGNMAPAMGAASPALRATVLQCVNQPAASARVQQAAIQAYRQTPVPEEGREILMQVLLDSASPLQKRVAAYLVLMKDPQPSELARLAAALPEEQDQQAKSFVISHIANIMSSTDPETELLRQKLFDALQTNEIGPIMDPTKFSRNYKIGSMEGNMIFEGTSYLPKEAMLEMTLKAFGYDADMMEIGLEGKGFEPTVEALFGENGFFPDTVMKTMYFVSDNMPFKVNEVLMNIVPALKKDRMKRQASQNLVKEIVRNLNKLVREMKTNPSPDAMVYLRLLGNELGYLRTNEMEEMAYSATMMIDKMLSMFPAEVMMGLMTKADNTMFAHYIFMDNEFFLPTATGVPLRVALSGTFTPGIKGGLNIARDMSEVTFMPSAGIEFVTQIGTHIPDFVSSGLEMHTNLFHESGLSAKISMGKDHVKLTMPALTTPTKLIQMTNSLVAVTGSEVMTIPSKVNDKVDVSECSPFIAGMKYCTALQYTDAFNAETAPYFPFTGDSKFAVELHPAGEVTEYTATIAYELLREGEEGRQKVDSVKLSLRAEGAEPTEARATMKYNRRKNVFTTEFQIPDCDIEAGFRLGVVDGATKGKGTHSISLDLINKNSPELSLVGRAKLSAMKEAMLQGQLIIPSMSAEMTVTANLKREEDLELEVQSNFKRLQTTSEQKLKLKYDTSRVEVEFKSDVNSEVMEIVPYADLIDKYGNNLLDMSVGETEMKVRHILQKFVEATNNYMEKYGADIPYMQNIRMPDMPEVTLPKTLFLNFNANGAYHFNDERFTIAIPLPLGGKSTEDLALPAALTTPSLSLPQFGVEIVSMEIPIPELFVPERLDLSLPLFGKVEISSVMKSNLYDLDASVAAGKDVVETPSYSAKFDVKGTSPLDIFSVQLEGSGMLAITESIKAHLKSALAHKFIEASISVIEEATITDKINVKSSSKIDATSPFGLSVALENIVMAEINTEEISAESNLEGLFKAGPIYGNTVSAQSVKISPFRPEANIDSSLKFDTSIGKAQNTIKATFVNGELSVMSNTNAMEDTLIQAVELAYKENKLSLKCDTNAIALGMKILNKAEASAGNGEVIMRMETNGEHSDNRVYSLLTASLDVNGLAVNGDATVKLLENEATHKATLTLNKDGLATSGTTTLQSLLSLENTFSAGLDASKATLSINNKAEMNDIKFDNANNMLLSLTHLEFNSKAEAIVSELASYNHDITIDVKPYIASANINNNLKVLAANLMNEAQLTAELYKIDLTGNLKAVYGDEEIKHTYQVNYADLTANAKCSTTGSIMGTHMNHNTEIEVVGLAARFTNDARFNSQPMRFDHTLRASFVPFDFNLDAIFNADGDLTLYGKHSAQLYGKVLLKAQPLAFASSHECRASLTQQLDNGFSLETTIDNKMDTVLMPQEQKTTLTLKSKMNNHALNQDVSVYNTAERTGMELSGTILTNILNTASTDNQDFTISGFLKYDKNTNSQVIQIPFVENVPAFLESMKVLVVSIAESVQNFINNEEVRAKLELLPQNLSEFVAQLNIEGKAMQMKQYLTDLTQEYAFTVEDVEATLMNLKVTLEKLLSDLSTYTLNYLDSLKNTIVTGYLPEALIQTIQQQMEEYDIKGMVVTVIDTIKDLIEQIDLEKLSGSSIAILRDIDTKFEIKAKLQTIVTELREYIETFDISNFASEWKTFILSIDFKARIEELVGEVATNIFTQITTLVREINENFDILGKINYLYAKMREVIVKFEADKKVEAILDMVVELMRSLKVEETIRALGNILKDTDILAKVTEVMQDAINYLKATEVKQIIEHLNAYLDTIVQGLKSFDYNAFVDQANEMIAKYTAIVNEWVRTLEIPQKLEATRGFVNFVLSSVRGYLEQLREIRVAEMIKSVKDALDQILLNDLKSFAETLKQVIINMDVNGEITALLELVSKSYTEVLSRSSQALAFVVDFIQTVVPEQKLFSELKQIITGLIQALKEIEINTPTFTFPLTDLVVPSKNFRMDNLENLVPTQMEIPEFTILGFYTVQANTVSFDDIKQRIFALIELIVNFEIKKLDVDVFFGDLAINYLPTMPELTFPEITLAEISLPTIPQVPVEKLVKTLQLPELMLPTIPSEIMIPCFGKLYGEIRFNTPVYAFKTSAELQNSTEDEMTPQFTGSLTSQASSPDFEFLNYKLDSTARIETPMLSQVVIAETLKFNHVALGVEHQASVTLNGPSGQAQAKTTVKVTTALYTADFVNTAVMAIKETMSASLDTAYNHLVNLPLIDVRSEATLTQKAVLRQDGYMLSLTVDNVGKVNLDSEEATHMSNMLVTVTPSLVTMTLSGETASSILKMNQQMTAEAALFRYIKFDIRNEAEGSLIKNSRLVATGYANLYDLKVELKANHDAELIGTTIAGDMSNGINVVARPTECLFDFQNKGNVNINLFEMLSAKIDLQNDYSAVIKPDSQQLNTVMLARVNQYKLFSNLTIDNNENEAGLSIAMDGEANLDFLTSPISIPEFELPLVDFRTPAITDLNLYEVTGLKDILITTDQTVDVDAKIVYKKSLFAPLVDVMGLIQIPSMGNLISELSFKSALVNLNVNAALNAEDDVVLRLGAITASEFDSLKAKLDGTASLTTKRGIKLANSLSLENIHIEGTHDSTISLSTETFETAVSVATVAKIALPILNLEVNQNLLADTKTKPTATSTLKMKGEFNIPVIKAVGNVEAEHNLKLEGTLEYLSMESTSKTNINSKGPEDYELLAILDNEANLYLNVDGLRSTHKVIADAKLNQGADKVISMDVNENLAVEVSLSRVYAVLKFTGNNEANLFTFNTNGKHVAQATIDFAPMSSLTAEIEIDMSQPSSVGDLTIFEKALLEMTAVKQKFSSNAKFVSPLYTTNLFAELEGQAPVFKITLKSSATSAFVILDHDLDGSITANLENEALNIISKLALTHTDLTMDVNHAITQALRRKRQVDDSISRHTLNVDITSPTFTDATFRYAASRDGISTSASIPSTGFLGLQLSGRVPSEMTARFYCRYASAPDADIDIIIIKSTPKDADKMNVQIAYNMDAPKDMLFELKKRMPSMVSTLTTFAEKYQITKNIEELKNAVVERVREAYNAAITYDIQMSQLSIFFRNTFVQYQKTVQVLLDAAVKLLRETQFKLPGSDDMTTLPEVLKKLTSSISAMLEKAIELVYENMEVYYSTLIEKLRNVKVSMPIGDAITGGQIFDQVKTAIKNIFDEVVDFVKNMESLDTMLVKIGETLKSIVEKSQEFVDSLNSDYLDGVLVYLNGLYLNILTVLNSVVEQLSAVNLEQLNNALDYVMNMLIYVVEQFNTTVSGVLQQTSQEAYVRASAGRLEIDLPFPFLQ
ncbi:apolipoprotein B-100-like [Genypterus blacodes]|uniref:apolipoprotein B-100-like n=1 Tax=Genypterus blacodes TaxID=154954 RepID=UPI003F769E58